MFDIANDAFAQFMVIVNYVCFGLLVGACLYIYWAAMIGQVTKPYKQAAVGAFIGVCVLIGLHSVLVTKFGITLLVPPIGTPYFMDFIRVIQFLASVAVVLLATFIFVAAALKNLAKEYGKHLMSALIFLGILILLHNYVLEETGVPLIFPPNLW